jgi:hypothetical protein
MSLRPTVSAFELAKMQALFGCGDADVAAAVNRWIRTHGTDSMSVRVKAREYVQTIVDKGRSAFAHHGQPHDVSGSIFWEKMFVDLTGKHVRADDAWLQRSLDDLLEGMPMFGRRNGSSWSYYAYLEHEMAVKLRDFLPSVPAWREASDFDEAHAWFTRVTKAGRDLWFWVS